jgi:hypothetical protein
MATLNLDPLLLGLIVTIIANIIIIAPVLWISGRLLAGKKAKFTHALWIVIIGTVIFYFFSYFLQDLIGFCYTVVPHTVSYLVGFGEAFL